jgi:hypothetical protein
MQFQSSSLCSVDGNDSDSHLIASALSGEQRAYTKLVDRYQGRLTSAIQNKVACSGLAMTLFKTHSCVPSKISIRFGVTVVFIPGCTALH